MATGCNRKSGPPPARADNAKVVEFLATDLSNYVTGQVVCVCGGMVLSPSPFRLAARAEGFRTRGNIDPLAAIERVVRRKLCINRLARDIGVPPNRISGIVNGKRSITADTALRLGKFFGTSAETWLDLQSDYDLRVIRRTAGDAIRAQVRVLAA